jgi:hypothetical protein
MVRPERSHVDFRSRSLSIYITNLAIKNAVIYTNEGNLDLRETVNEPLTTALRDK